MLLKFWLLFSVSLQASNLCTFFLYIVQGFFSIILSYKYNWHLSGFTLTLAGNSVQFIFCFELLPNFWLLVSVFLQASLLCTLYMYIAHGVFSVLLFFKYSWHLSGFPLTFAMNSVQSIFVKCCWNSDL